MLEAPWFSHLATAFVLVSFISSSCPLPLCPRVACSSGNGWDGSSNFNFVKELCSRYAGKAPNKVQPVLFIVWHSIGYLISSLVLIHSRVRAPLA